MRGKIRAYDPKKGYGWVGVRGEERDFFIHYKNIVEAEGRDVAFGGVLKKGQLVEFDPASDIRGRGPIATNVKVVKK